MARKVYFGQNAEISDFFFPLLEDVGGFGLYWTCGINGDGNERKQKGRSGQMSGGGTTESYIGFGYESAF